MSKAIVLFLNLYNIFVLNNLFRKLGNLGNLHLGPFHTSERMGFTKRLSRFLLSSSQLIDQCLALSPLVLLAIPHLSQCPLQPNHLP